MQLYALAGRPDVADSVIRSERDGTLQRRLMGLIISPEQIAERYKVEGRYPSAAEEFLRLGRHIDAGQMYEQGREYALAAAQYRAAGWGCPARPVAPWSWRRIGVAPRRSMLKPAMHVRLPICIGRPAIMGRRPGATRHRAGPCWRRANGNRSSNGCAPRACTPRPATIAKPPKPGCAWGPAIARPRAFWLGRAERPGRAAAFRGDRGAV